MRRPRQRLNVSYCLALAFTLLASGCARESAPAPAAAPAASAASGGVVTDAEKVLNVYNWSDYIDPTVIPAFEKDYGIKVNYDVYDSNEVLETKLLAGHTGYDIVVPSASFLQRQIQAGVFRQLDKQLLPNLKNIDPTIAHLLEMNDPGNRYGVDYLWGTSGVGYNINKIAAAMTQAPANSFAMLYDPSVVQHFKDCGVSILDAPDEVVGTVLLYLGRDPNSEQAEDLQAAQRVLLAIRPYVRYINSSKYIDDLANGDICLALGWGGDVGQARVRAQEAGNGVKLRYNIAREGAVLFFDMLAIPADAPHPRNAHLFINYLLRPDVAAKNSVQTHFATSNAAAYPLIDPALYPRSRALPDRGSARASDSERRAHSDVYARAQPRVDTLQNWNVTEASATLSAASRAASSAASSASSTAAYVQLEGVTKRFGDFVAVNNVSLGVERGEIFCLLGASGSGKTTLLRLLAGFELPSTGRLLLDGQDLAGVPPYRRPLNMMFQSYALFPHLTVERNVAFGLEQERLSKSEISRRVGEILEVVKMSAYRGRRPDQLSGGQRQRVALARASSSGQNCCCSTSRWAHSIASCAGAPNSNC